MLDWLFAQDNNEWITANEGVTVSTSSLWNTEFTSNWLFQTSN